MQVWQFDWAEVQAMTAMLSRTMTLNVSIVGGIIYLDNGSASTSLEPRRLCGSD
jgi:uncharacterized protein YaeQ